jgi:hypothetical protein
MARSKAVDAWFQRYDNPMKDVVQRIRAIVLGADKRAWRHVRYPCARISEDDVKRVLPALGFDMRSSLVEGVSIDSQRETGVAGVVLVAAKKTL